MNYKKIALSLTMCSSFFSGSIVANELAALQKQQEYQNIINWKLAPVKNSVSLKKELSNSNSPLNKLSNDAKDRLVKSIVFRENGIGGLYMGDLEAELTPTEIYRILSLFGAQRIITHFDNARIESDTDFLLLSKPKFDTGDNQINRLPSLTPDHEEYECIGRATCRSAGGHICMSGC